MQAQDFEWDEIKAAENYAKHGVSFEMARAVFEDVFAIERLDDREDCGEERLAIIGMSGHTLLVRGPYPARDAHPTDLGKTSNQT